MVPKKVQVMWVSKGLLGGCGEIGELKRRVGKGAKEVLALVKVQKGRVKGMC